MVFLLDLLKGAAAVWLARYFQLSETAVLVVMLAVVVGHIWPVQLRFQGGKGLSTLVGTTLAFDWPLVLAMGAVAGVFILVSRHATVSVLAAIATAPILAWVLGRGAMEIAGMTALVGLVLWAHRSNLREAIAGVPPAGPIDAAGANTEARS
jgi:glycerol-3-phosphate acyltransferase PlsY